MRALRVLVACEFSGIVRDAFTAAGHYAMSCDLLETESPGPHFKGDVREVLDAGWDMLIAHPTCTYLANSGVRWLHTRPERWALLAEGAVFYRLLRDAPIPRRAIENPVMHSHARKLIQPGRRQVVQPWWFGDPQFKAVGLEIIGLPALVATNKLTPPKPGSEEHKQWSRVHRMAPGPDRQKERSRFFRGIANAMADQWGNPLALDLAA